MRWLILVLFGILLCGAFVSAICQEGQIDINTASKIDLEKITQIGNATAWKIIWSREELGTFNSVDDLMRVSGLGGKGTKVNKIKEQGLACVGEEIVENVEEKISDGPNEEIIFAKEEISETSENEESFNSKTETYVPETIKLEAKSIKSEGNLEKVDNKNFMKYGFVVFCVLIGFLFNLKRNKYKNGLD